MKTLNYPRWIQIVAAPDSSTDVQIHGKAAALPYRTWVGRCCRNALIVAFALLAAVFVAVCNCTVVRNLADIIDSNSTGLSPTIYRVRVGE